MKLIISIKKVFFLLINKIVSDFETNVSFYKNNVGIKKVTTVLINNNGFEYKNSFSKGDPLHKKEQYSQVVPIHSVTKMFTAFLFLIAIQEGKISLDDMISKYMQDFHLYFNRINCVNNITFRHLLSHASGLHAEARLGNNYSFETVSFYEHIKSINHSQLKFIPGEQFSYTNLGYDLTGYCLEKIYNTPLENLMQEKIFSPMGMFDSTFERYSYRDKVSIENLSLIKMAAMKPSCGMYSSINDLIKFTAMLLNNGFYNNKQIIKPEILLHMQKLQFLKTHQRAGYCIGSRKIKAKNISLYSNYGISYDTYLNITWVPQNGMASVFYCNYRNKDSLDKVMRMDPFYNNIWLNSPWCENKKNEAYITSNYDENIFKPFVGSYIFSDNRLLFIKIESGKLLFCLDNSKNWIPAKCLYDEYITFEDIITNEIINTYYVKFLRNPDGSKFIIMHSSYFYEILNKNQGKPSEIQELMGYIGKYYMPLKNDMNIESNILKKLNRLKLYQHTIELIDNSLLLDNTFWLEKVDENMLRKMNGGVIYFEENIAYFENIKYQRKICGNNERE